MAVKIRLARRGRKQLAMFDVVVADSRSPRDGRFIERIGTYNPNTNPASIELNADRALYWVMVGAQPTDTTHAILRYKGVMMRKHLQVGVNKGSITQDVADERYNQWFEEKGSRVASKVTGLADTKAATRATRLEAEGKVRAARQEGIDQKNAEAKVASDALKLAEQEAQAISERNQKDAAAAATADLAAAAPTVEAPVNEVAEAPVAEVAKAPDAEVAEAPLAEAPVAEAPTAVVTETPTAEISAPVTEEVTPEVEAAEPKAEVTAEEKKAAE